MERKRNRRICSASPPQSATYWVLRILTETGQGAPTPHHSRPHEGCWEKIRPLPERRRQSKQAAAGGHPPWGHLKSHLKSPSAARNSWRVWHCGVLAGKVLSQPLQASRGPCQHGDHQRPPR